MTYKFHLAGPGSPEIEMRRAWFQRGYRLFIDSKPVNKVIYPNRLDNIQLSDGSSYEIVCYLSFPAMPFTPPLVSINHKIVNSFPEPIKFYESVTYFILFITIILLTVFNANVRGLSNVGRLLGVLIVIAEFGLLYFTQYLYYFKIRSKLGVSNRIGFFAFTLVLLYVIMNGGMALIRMLIH